MPRAGDAFLNGALPVTHDPLARIDTNRHKPTLDLEAFFQQIVDFVVDYIFPAIKRLTGVDLGFLGTIIENLQNLFGGQLDFESLITDFGGVWMNVTNVFLKPLEVFADLINGTINALQIPLLDPSKILGLVNMIRQPFEDLVNILVDVLDSIPLIGHPLGDALQDLANMFGLLKTKADSAQSTGDVAQKSADSANVGVAMLIAQRGAADVPGGVSIHDTFDRVGSNLGSNYVATFFDAGNGSWRTTGTNLNWVKADANPRSVHARRVETLATDYQSGQIVQDAPVANSNAQYTAIKILLRQNASQTRCVAATVKGTTAEIGCWVDGTYTVFGAPVTIPNDTGDRWELWAGTTLANVREFVLFRNGNEVLRRTDTGAVSYYGSDYRYPGPGARAGVKFSGFPPFATYSQASPPDLQSFDANDRPPVT